MANSKIIVLLFAILVPSAILAASVSEEHRIQKWSMDTCDSFQEGGSWCTSCNTVRACLPFNIALNITCGRYCRNGHCSVFRGSLCSDTTTTSSTTTSSTTTSTTSTTTTPMPET